MKQKVRLCEIVILSNKPSTAAKKAIWHSPLLAPHIWSHTILYLGWAQTEWITIIESKPVEWMQKKVRFYSGLKKKIKKNMPSAKQSIFPTLLFWVRFEVKDIEHRKTGSNQKCINKITMESVQQCTSKLF